MIGRSTVLPSTIGGDVKFDSDYSKKLKPSASGDITMAGTRWLVEKMAVVTESVIALTVTSTLTTQVEKGTQLLFKSEVSLKLALRTLPG